MSVPTIALTAPVGPGDAPLLVLGPSLGTSTILWENALPRSGRALPRRRVGPARARSLADDDRAVHRRRPRRRRRDRDPRARRRAGALRRSLARRCDRPGARAAASRPRLRARDRRVGCAARRARRRGTSARRTVRAQSTSVLIIPSAQRWFAPGSVQREPDLSGRLLHALRDADDESYALCCEALAAYDVRDRLGEIRMPVVALWGEHDAVAPEAKAARDRGRSRGRPRRDDRGCGAPAARGGAWPRRHPRCSRSSRCRREGARA